jgi:hypothetical protein
VADQREPRRRQVDPLLAVAADAAGAGLRGADKVIEELSVLRRSAGRGSAGAAASRGRAARARAGRARSGSYGTGSNPGGPSTPAGGTSTADLFVELLERFGETIQDIAAAIGEREWFEGEPDWHVLELPGAPGGRAAIEFDFTNTGPSVLTKVTFKATDLLGSADQIDADQVSFRHEDDPHIPRVGPGRRATVIVEVAIPEDVYGGAYRGVITARSAAPEGRGAEEGGPADAWAVIELKVSATDPRSPIAPAKPKREA